MANVRNARRLPELISVPGKCQLQRGWESGPKRWLYLGTKRRAAFPLVIRIVQGSPTRDGQRRWYVHAGQRSLRKPLAQSHRSRISRHLGCFGIRLVPVAFVFRL